MNWKWIHDACWAGDALEVEHLLVEGADPNQVAPTTWRQTPLDMTPVWLAAAHAGNWRVADRLLREGADPNVGTSLLHSSCQWHFEHLLSALEYFARNGWDLNGLDADGHTALHKATFLRYRRAVRTLLALGAEGTPLVP